MPAALTRRHRAGGQRPLPATRPGLRAHGGHLLWTVMLVLVATTPLDARAGAPAASAKRLGAAAKPAPPPPPTESAPAVAAASAPEATAAGEAEAKRLFAKGERAYDVGKFAEALEAFTAAYEAAPLPGLLFNIGQCHRQLGHHREALFVFGRYVDLSDPADTNVGLAREFMAEQRRLDARDAPIAQPLEPTNQATAASPQLTEPASPPLTSRPLFWGVVGGVVVAAAAATAVVLLVPGTRAPAPTTLPDISGR